MSNREYLIKVKTSKNIEALTDIIANRVYTIDGVADVEAIDITDVDFSEEEEDASPSDKLNRAVRAFVEAWNGR